MAWNGPETRCTLQVNLVRYHPHLVPGLQGTLVPLVETTSWGKNPRFGAVKFDCCGHTLDIVLDNLTIEVSPGDEPKAPPPEVQAEVRGLLADIED